MGTQDSSFLMFEEPHTHMHVAGLGIFEAGPLLRPDGGLDSARIRSYVDSMLDRLPRYRQRVAYTPIEKRLLWIDDERFNLEYHVRHTCLPKPGDEETLKALVGRILSQHLDRDKPLWEIYVIEGLEGDRFAMLMKTHHCMVDGIAGMALLNRLLSPDPDLEVGPASAWRPQPAPGALWLLADVVDRRVATPLAEAARAVGHAMREPRRTWEELSESLRSMAGAVADGFRIVARTPHNQPIGTHRRVDWIALDLAELKDLKKHLGGTVNDVILTLVTGAVRRFLRHRRARVRGFDYRVVIPVNLRVLGETEEVAAGNRVSAWFLSLPIGETDPLRRFQRIHRETDRLHRSKTAQGMDLFTRIVDWTGSPLLTWAGVQIAARVHPYHLIVSNVPGPPMPLYFLGARLLAFYPQPPLFETQGLGVAVISYAGQVCFGLVGDWDVMPDLDVVVDGIREAKDELVAAVARRERT
jgi:WS/DGAT/MGAT family acyltransferase